MELDLDDQNTEEDALPLEEGTDMTGTQADETGVPDAETSIDESSIGTYPEDQAKEDADAAFKKVEQMIGRAVSSALNRRGIVPRSRVAGSPLEMTAPMSAMTPMVETKQIPEYQPRPEDQMPSNQSLSFDNPQQFAQYVITPTITFSKFPALMHFLNKELNLANLSENELAEARALCSVISDAVAIGVYGTAERYYWDLITLILLTRSVGAKQLNLLSTTRSVVENRIDAEPPQRRRLRDDMGKFAQ